MGRPGPLPIVTGMTPSSIVHPEPGKDTLDSDLEVSHSRCGILQTVAVGLI